MPIINLNLNEKIFFEILVFISLLNNYSSFYSIILKFKKNKLISYII